jgi:ATP-dependent helicase HrpB
MPPPLPIDDILPQILASLRTANCAVVVAPPGAGKTTRVAPALAGEFPAVVMLQPRRVAARAAASRIAAEQRWSLGREVGFHIRFERRLTPQTRVRVLTEGILTRQIQSDPFLEGIGCVILDEFHERSIHTDLALALLREIQSSVRPDLRIVVMSATMDPDPVSRFLGNAPVHVSEGRLFPVDIEYAPRQGTEPVWDRAAAACRRAVAEGEGHVLVFLPGIGEIRRTEQLLGGIDAEIHVLHSSISGDAQDRALAPASRRKLILATNIAETSITIDGVRTVVDSGTARVLVNDPRLGIDRLELRRISRASANQRAGRAGRTAPGRCLRLWTRLEDAGLEDTQPPEIQRVDLAGTLLALRAYGIRDPRSFAWYDPPRPEALERAEQLLLMLGATTRDGALTPLGEKLTALPLHPRIGTLLVAGAKQGLLREAATMAALLSERDILAGGHQARRRDAGWEGTSDLLDRMEMLENPRAFSTVDPAAIRSVERVRDELLEIAKRLLT